MTESTRGFAEEASGAPATPAENNAPASPASTAGDSDEVRARGFAEDATDSPPTE